MKKANKKDSFSGQRQQRDEEGAEGAETGVGASNISGSLIHYLLDQRNDMSKERFLERPFAERAAWRMHNWALITMASNAIAVLKRARTDPIGNEITSLYQVFLNSIEVPGYRRAEQSWVRALGLFFKKHGIMELPGPYELRIGKKKVYLPEGSKAFIQSTTRKSERGKSLWEYLDYCILTRWLHGCLWLMADDAARPALEAFMGLSIKEADYIKHRQRLKLIDWKAAHKKPPIIGYSLPKQRFVFEEGWTHLDSKLSR